MNDARRLALLEPGRGSAQDVTRLWKIDRTFLALAREERVEIEVGALEYKDELPSQTRVERGAVFVEVGSAAAWRQDAGHSGARRPLVPAGHVDTQQRHRRAARKLRSCPQLHLKRCRGPEQLERNLLPHPAPPRGA